MMISASNIRRGIVSLLVLSLSVGLATSSARADDERDHGLHTGSALTVITDEGRVIAHVLGAAVGDSYINQENELFEVVRIDGDRVIVEHKGRAEMPDVTDALQAMERAETARQSAHQTGLLQKLLGAAGRNRGIDVGIYHTHNAESYVPTSGTDSKEYGDIHKVGQALKDAFEAKGLNVEWTDDSHLPHDGQAYIRSRRTVSELSRRGPTTMLDVHRDAIPTVESYSTKVDGVDMTQVRLVVGRQNQNREANLEYAKRIKAIADEKYPGLIMGIYHARGNYNQDLGPRMMLLEFGTHVTTLEQALRSVEPMADVITAAAGLTPGAGDGNVGSAGRSTAMWLILLVVAGGVGWVLLNKEGFAGVRSRVGQLFGGRNEEDGDNEQ